MLLTLAPLIPVALLLSLIAIRFWSAAIIGVLIWAMVEGAVRKWLVPGYQSQVLLAKDVVLVFAYIGYFVSPKRSLGLGPKSATLLFLVLLEGAYCCLQLINPNSPSTLLSLFGFKNYLIYIPLAFIVPDIITSRETLRKLLFATCYVAIPITLLGLYQFSQPPSSWVNKYVSHEEGVEATVSLFGQQGGEGEFALGRARTSSTFSYIGGFMTFLLLSAPLAMSLLLAAVPKHRKLIAVVATLAFSVGASATTGSRTPVVAYALATPLLLFIAGAKGLLPFQTAVRLAAGAAIAGLLSFALFGSAFSALEYRANNSDSAITRLASPIVETLNAFQTSPIAGTGIGSNSNAATSIMGSDVLWWLDGNSYEMETARVMQEGGFIGFVLVFLPKLFAIILILSMLRRSRSPMMIATHMAALIFVLIHFVLFTINNPTGGLIYWTIIGVSIAAHRIEMMEQRLREEQAFHFERGFSYDEMTLA